MYQSRRQHRQRARGYLLSSNTGSPLPSPTHPPSLSHVTTVSAPSSPTPASLNRGSERPRFTSLDFPPWGGPSTISSHQGRFGRDTALGAGAVETEGLAEHELRDRGAGSDIGTGGTGSTGIGSGTAGYGPEPWQHNHDQHGHAYEGDPCGSETAVTGAPHFTTGPHVTDTANRLDPNVQSEIGAVGSTTGTGHHGHHHGHHHGNKDTTTGTGFGSTENQSSEQPTQTPGLSGTTTSATAGTNPGATLSTTPINDQQTGSSHHYGQAATVRREIHVHHHHHVHHQHHVHHYYH